MITIQGIIYTLCFQLKNDMTRDYDVEYRFTAGAGDGTLAQMIVTLDGDLKATVTGGKRDTGFMVEAHAVDDRSVRKTFRVFDDFSGSDTRIDERRLYADVMQFIDDVVNQEVEA